MKIAYIIPALNNQAPIVIATTLAERFALKGHDVTIYYFDQNVERKLAPGVTTKRIKFFQPIPWHEFDIIHSHMLRPDAYVFFHKPFFSKTSTITTSHNYIYPELRNYHGLLASLVFGHLWNIFWTRMNRICVLSGDAEKYYKKISINKKISICHNGISIDMQAEVSRSAVAACKAFKERFSFVIGTYCNLIRRKRIDRLINLVERLDGVGLIIIGDGPEFAALNELAKANNILEKVLFLGYQRNAHQFNKYFDIFAVPSEDEGFGLSLIEAALHEKNIICSNIPVFREIFTLNAVTFFDDTDSSLEDAYHAAFLDKTKPFVAKSMALEFYSDNSMAEAYYSVYQRVNDSI